jgi:hypothetical protein
LQYSITVLCSLRCGESTPQPRELKHSFGVFLCHNCQDKLEIRELNRKLREEDIHTWLDEEQLRPGVTWQSEVEEIIATCGSALICVGASGIGPWHESEMRGLLSRLVEESQRGRTIPVIPVLLPGAPDDVELPLFLKGHKWVDLRSGYSKAAIDQLIWGITGTKP